MDRALGRIKKLCEDLSSDLANHYLWYRSVDRIPKDIYSYIIGAARSLTYDMIDEPEVAEILKNDESLRAVKLMDYPFKIKKENTGMQNFGYGIYFASNYKWASRYGSFTFVSRVMPKEIAVIKDFQSEWVKLSGGLGTDIANYFQEMGIDLHSEQAPLFPKLIKKFAGKDKKALLVNNSSDSIDAQLCVYNTSAIYTKYLIYKNGDL